MCWKEYLTIVAPARTWCIQLCQAYVIKVCLSCDADREERKWRFIIDVSLVAVEKLE